jgi:hypothetical protein
MKKVFFLLSLYSCTFLLNSKIALAETPDSLVNSIDYDVKIQYDGTYSLNIQNVLFKRQSSILNILRDFSLNEYQVKNSFKSTGVTLKKIQSNYNCSDPQNCNAKSFQITNNSIKDGVSNKLNSNCSLTSNMFNFSLTCKLKQDKDSEDLFDFSSSIPTSETKCNNPENSSFTVCSFKFTGKALPFSYLFIKKPAYRMAYSGTIVSLKSTINLMLQSHGFFPTADLTQKKDSIRDALFYNQKLDYWKRLNNIFDNNLMHNIKVKSDANSNTFEIYELKK